MNMFWALRNTFDAQNAAAAAQDSIHEARRARDAMGRLEDRIDNLVLVNMALWSLVKEKTDLTDEDLNQRVQELDLSDGKLDGKIRGNVIDCPQCQRTMSQKHQRCLYCGHQEEGKTAFDAVAR